MKALSYSILALSIMAISCDDFLDVEPKGMVIPNTVEEYDLLLNSSGASITNVTYMSPEYYIPEEHFLTRPNSTKSAYLWSDFQYLTDEQDDDWNSNYAQIYSCNEVIHNIDAAETLTMNETLRNTVKGQAYADRAKCYFALINSYAKHYSPSTLNDMGVPLILKNDILQKSKRASIGKVYEQITKDLQIAKSLVPAIVKDNEKAKASQQGLAAFTAKVFLFKGEIDSAMLYINKAFKTSPTLNNFNNFIRANVTYVFNKHTLPRFAHENKEIIWSGGLLSNYWYEVAFYSPELANLFDQTNDLRFYFWASKVDRSGNEYSAFRYVNHGGRTFSASAGEMYLLRAECYARKGDFSKAIEDLNTLRKNRYRTGSNYELSATNAAEALAHVKNERLRELAFTGLNLLDQKRYNALGEPVSTYTRAFDGKTYTLDPNSPRYVCSIPRYVISKNSNIEQNPR